MSITGTIIEITPVNKEEQRYIVVKEKNNYPQTAVLRINWPTSLDFSGKIGDKITANFDLHAFTMRNGRFANCLDVWAYTIHDEKHINDITPDEETINK